MAVTTYVKKSRIHASVQDVFAWHARPGALERLTPPWTPMRVVEKTGLIEPGTRVLLKLKAGPVWYDWSSQHTELVENQMFADEQISGPFSVWRHRHRFHEDGGDCIYEDNIQHRLPLHPLSTLIAGGWAARQIDSMFAWRHETVARDIAQHRQYPCIKPQTVLISGASGLLGTALTPFLTTGGHRVLKLVRRQPASRDEVFWDPAAGLLNPEEIAGVDVVIHLAGDNIGQGAWTPEKKRIIIDSRERGTSLITRTLAAMQDKPRVLVCASAIGYYGDTGDRIATESQGPGSQFVSEVCDRWERSAAPALQAGIRTVFARIGVVLSPKGGALAEFLPLFQMGLGGPVGSGKQYMSWIGIDDAMGALWHVACQDAVTGPVNIVAPNPVTNREFAKTLGRALHRPALLPAPAFVIKMLFGQKGREIVLSSNRISAEKLMESGYAFRYPEAEAALRHMLGKSPDYQ